MCTRAVVLVVQGLWLYWKSGHSQATWQKGLDPFHTDSISLATLASCFETGASAGVEKRCRCFFKVFFWGVWVT